MAMVEKKSVCVDARTVQGNWHARLNSFSDTETLVEAVASRPGFPGANPLCQLSLLARRPSVRFDDIQEAVAADKVLIRAGAFRGALFVLAAEDYPLYFHALRGVLREAGMQPLVQAGILHDTLQSCAAVLRRESWQGACRHDHEVLELLQPMLACRPKGDLAGLTLRKLCDAGVLVRVAAKAATSNQFTYGLMHEWFPALQENPLEEKEARAELLRHYLACHAPATVQDMIWWTGLSAKETKQALEALGKELVPVRVQGDKRSFIALRESLAGGRAPLLQKPSVKSERFEGRGSEQEKPRSGPPGAVVFLPPWDPFPLGWENKSLILEKKWQPWVYASAANAASVIVHRGRIVGVWQLQGGSRAALELHVFATTAKGDKAAVLAQAPKFAKQVAGVFGLSDVGIAERPLPQPLRERAAGSFLWPLGRSTPQQVSFIDRRRGNAFRKTYLSGPPSRAGD
ncbi:MAG: winged helix DNA-binding domain-containing protein [Myxococcota bacterium]